MLKEVLYIDNVETLSVLADSFRLEILKHLKDKPYSPHKLSKILGKSAQNVNYHFKMLFEAGIIYKKFEERKRGAFETYYQVIANILRVDNRFLNNNIQTETFKGLDTCEMELINDFNNYKIRIAESSEFKNKEELLQKVKTDPDGKRYILISVTE